MVRPAFFKEVSTADDKVIGFLGKTLYTIIKLEKNNNVGEFFNLLEK